MKKLVAALGIAVMVFGVSLGLSVGSAHASAYGCTYGNPFVDPNTWCVALVGTGTFVNYVNGNFSGGTVVCNAQMYVVFYNTSWGWLQTVKSNQLSYCATGNTFKINFNSYKSAGNMCAELHYNSPGVGNRTMTKCFGIR